MMGPGTGTGRRKQLVTIEDYVSSLNWAVEQHWEQAGFRQQRPVIAVDPAARPSSKYVRVVRMEGGVPRSLHSWVERATGKIAGGSYAAPAKGTGKATKGQLLSRYTVETAIPAIAENPNAWVYGSPYYSAVSA
jgi:hypothetical protein